MRITCPNCTAHFEIPAELLGRKGRSLKCAICGHSWYQTPQVETIDLAEIMGEEYAAKAKADMGVGQPSSAPPPGQQQRPQARPPMGPQAGGMPPNMGPGAQSLRGGRPGQMPGQQPPWNNPQQPMQQRPGVPPPNAPAWYQPTQAPGVPMGPGGNPAFPPQGAPPGAPGGPAAANWYQQQPPPGAGGPGGPQAAPWYNPQQPGQPGAPPPAQPAWYQGAPQMGPGAAPPPGMNPAGFQGGPPAGPGVGAAALGNSMMGGPGAQVPGQGAVSWMQNPGQNVGQPPPGANMGVMHMQRDPRTGAPMAGGSMMGQAGSAQGPGEGAVSWMKNPGQAAPGMPGQSLQHQGPGGPGGMAVSQMGAQVAAPGQGAMSQMTGNHIAAPGQAAVSLLDGGVQAPGVAGNSMMGNMPQGPGAGAVSQLSGETIAAPGDVAHSLLDGTVQQAQPGQSMLQDAATGGQPGTSMQHDAGAGSVAHPDTLGANAANARAQEGGGIKGPDGKLVTDPTKAKTEAELVAGEEGAEEKAALFTSAKDDEELVDPNADRPDFGSTEEEDAAADEDDEDEEEAAAAAAAKPPPFKPPRKPIDPAYITAGLMVVATLAVGAVVYSQRAALMKSMPGMAQIYEKLGMTPKNPGEGLRLAQSGMRLQHIGGVETLVVKGYISNIGQTARDVPNLRLQLIDATNAVVQEVKSPAPKANLDPGGSVDYEMRLELPDMTKAKNVVVAWDAGG